MGSEWPIMTLGELCPTITDGAHQSPKSVDVGMPMASVKDLTRFGVDVSGARKISGEDFAFLVRQGCKPQKDDVLIAKDGNSALDTVCTVNGEADYVLLSSVAILRPDTNQLDSNFLKYYFCSEQTLDYLKSNFISGAAIPRVILKDFKKAEISLPPLHKQKAIAHILRSLDDKIELNRRMNATLEGVAQALFKSWFVDFDPVIDNALAAGNPIPEELAERAEVRRKALANGTANREAAKQFPAAFQRTEEMGWIPEGWEVGQMSDHALIEMGQSPKGNTYNSNGEGTPLVNGPVEFGPYFTNRSKWTTSPTKLSHKGDLIVCVRGSTTGRFVKSDDRYCLGRGVCSVRGKRSQCFVDQIFKSSITEMLGLTTGSTFPNWSRQTLSGFAAIVPPNSIVDKFDEYISQKIERIESGFLESASLSKLRDTLLPKLISGELRIPEAEKLTEEALV
ncbi:restriction endonuclease subunit S [Desulfobacula toluolica]|uniref:HsdS: type I restriction modification system methylase n=1 Tax=Desulfobacula toluolica (strain DSM 7467 / Tol2) TaxID=651182 RepID=K0NBU1_DESTT|nr:restriction endonuclease subunit S [Desulfobacula toluolica]CCK81889.1 HsdS: type I restriction modification system methylase [Desulfobacula toluolica Tol2]